VDAAPGPGRHPPVRSLVFSQLDEALDAVELSLDAEQMDRLNNA
jgi:hypothetical protein